MIKNFISQLIMNFKFIAREQVWYTFLDRVEGKNKSQVNVENLKNRPINGREIKTAVRLAKVIDYLYLKIHIILT